MRIFFNATGAIVGANIDWYLLEKSRVTARSSGERNYHVFYQLLRGADAQLKSRLNAIPAPIQADSVPLNRTPAA